MIKTALKSLLYSLLTIFLLTSAATLTEWGSKQSIQLLRLLVPNLNIVDFQGTLAHHFTIASLEYRNDHQKIHAKNINLTWQVKLFHQSISIKSLALSNLKWQQDKQLSYQIENIKLSGELARTENHHLITSWQKIRIADDVIKPGQLKFDGNAGQLKQFEIDVASAHLNIQQKTNGAQQYHWQLNAANVADLIEDATGHMQASGDLKTNKNDFHISGKFSIKALHLAHISCEKAKGHFNVSNNFEVPTAATVLLTKLHLPHQKIDSIKLTTIGNLHHLNYHLTSLFNGNQLRAHATLNKKSNEWRLNIKSFSLNVKKQGIWQLHKSQGIRILKNKILIPTQRFQSQHQRIQVSGNYQNSEHWQLNSHWAQLHLNNLKPWLPHKLSLKGTVNGVLTASQTNKQAQAELALTSNRVNLKFPYQNKLITQSLTGVTLKASLNQKGLNGTVNIKLPDNHKLQGEFKLAKVHSFKITNQHSPLSARLIFNTNNLKLLTAFLPNLDETKGEVSASLNIKGYLDNPKFNGALHLKHGRFKVTSLNTTYTNIELRATTTDFDTVSITGSAHSGPGMLTLTGAAQPFVKTFKLHLKGNDFQISNTKLMKIRVRPHLILNYNPKKLSLSGDITISKANIILAGQFTSQSLSPDVHIIKQHRRQGAMTVPIDANVTLVVDPKVHLKAQGLTGDLSGKVTIIQTSPAPATAEGSLQINNGQFNAYGQTLSIETGKILFLGGNIRNPGIDIRAVKTLTLSNNLNKSPLKITGTQIASNAKSFSTQGSLIVGIAAQNTLNHPKITLFSTPPGISQSNILSLIVLGKPVSQATSSSAQLLLTAASALNIGGSQSSQITDQLKRNLGLDVVEVNSSQQYSGQTGQVTQGMSLILGKYLTPNLYVDYSAGIVDEESYLELTYHLNKIWSVKTKTGAHTTGADVFYSIATD